MTGRSRGRRVEQRRALAVAVGAAAAIASGCRFTGQPALDVLWAVLVGGAAAYLGTRSRRELAIGLGAVAALVSPGGLSLALAALAVAAGLWSVRRLHREAIAARGASAGLAVSSALASTGSTWVAAGVVVAGLTLLGVGAYARFDRLERKLVRRVVVVCGVVLVGGVALFLATVYQVLGDVRRVEEEVDRALAAVESGDLDGAIAALQTSEGLLDEIDSELRISSPLLAIPLLGQQRLAVQTAVSSLKPVVSASVQLSNLLVPGLSGDGVAGTIDSEPLVASANSIARLRSALTDAETDLTDAEGQFLIGPLSQRLDELRHFVSQASALADGLAAAAEHLPDLLGEGDGRARYLVLFTSSSESRGRFGFPGGYAELIVDDGKLSLGESGSTSDDLVGIPIDQSAFDLSDPMIRPYSGFGATREFRSVTIPIDFPTVASNAAQMWQLSGHQPVDGVIRLAPRSLATLMQISGPVTLPDRIEPLTPDNVASFVEFEQYLEYPSDALERRDLLNEVSEQVFRQLIRSPMGDVAELVSLLSANVANGDVHVWTESDSDDGLLADLGVDGHWTPPDDDGLMVTTTNGGGNKIDSFLDTDVRYSRRYVDGGARGTVSVRLTNNAPSSDLPFYLIGSSTDPPLPPGTNRAIVDFHTRNRPSSLNVAGEPTPFSTFRVGEWWVSRVTVDLNAGESVELEMTVEGQYFGDVTIVPGGSVRPAHFTLNIDDEVIFDDLVLVETRVGIGSAPDD